MPTSAFFDAQLDRIAAGAALGPVVDVACGRGRHALACVRAGWPTLAIDREASHLRAVVASAPSGARLACVRTDLETGHGIPVRAGSCGVILVFRFLFRPLATALAAALAPGGVLVYETFTTGQRALGYGPTRDAFLLEPGELPRLFPGLEILEYDEGLTAEMRPAHTARLVARRPATA